MESMSGDELTDWVAYYNLKEESYRERIEKDVSLEDGANKTQEDLAEDMRKMIMGIQNG